MAASTSKAKPKSKKDIDAENAVDQVVLKVPDLKLADDCYHLVHDEKKPDKDPVFQVSHFSFCMTGIHFYVLCA